RKIDEHVVEGSIVVTDDYYGYRKMPPVYDHKSVKHSAKEYVRKERDFKVHTNTVESKFSLLKRGIVGTFHQVSKKHLPLYLAEFDHRFNRWPCQQQNQFTYRSRSSLTTQCAKRCASRHRQAAKRLRRSEERR